jgi:hypothetical protein
MQQRNPSPAPPCHYAKWLQETVDVLFNEVNEHTTPEQFYQCQETLRSLHEELEAELKTIGRFHYSSPTGSLHRCITQVYQHAKAQLRFMELLHHSLPPPGLAQRQQPHRSPDAVVNDIASLADSIKRPQEILLGEERDGGNSPTGVSR